MVEEGDQENTLWSLSKLRQMAKGNETFVLKMQKLFVEQTLVRLAELERAVSEENYAQVGEIAHKMKPALDTFCIDSMKETVRRLEKAAEMPAIENRQLTADFLAVLKKVVLEMQQAA